MVRSVFAFASWLRSAGGSAIAACISCSDVRAQYEPQEAATALPRGTAPGAPPRRAQAGARHQGADDDAARSEPALDPGLRVRHVHRQPAVQILAVVDDFTRECLWLVADTSLPGLRVARELDALIAARGRPAMCVSDNGTELTSMAILRWSQETQVEWHYIAPGKPSRTPSSRASMAGCATSC